MIRLLDLLKEETFTAINKDSGKVSVFKSKDSRDAAVKAGTHSKKEDDGEKEQPKGDKPNMFSKDAGYDTPDTDKSKKSKPKLDNAYDAKDFESHIESLKGKIDDSEYEDIKGEMEALKYMQMDMQDLDDAGEDTYNEKIEIDSAVEELKDRINAAMASSKKTKVSEPKAEPKPQRKNIGWMDRTDEERVDILVSGDISDFTGNGFLNAVDAQVWDMDASQLGAAWNRLLKNASPNGQKKWNTNKVSITDTIAKLQKLEADGFSDDSPEVEEIKQELRGFFSDLNRNDSFTKNNDTEFASKSEEPKAEPKQQRKGNPEVNKATKAKAEELGITPEKLGNDEYQKKMAQAAYQALTDANFHSEARELIAKLEGKPELAQKPNYPSPSDPKFIEKMDDIFKKYASEYKEVEDDDVATELGFHASGQAGWDGGSAVDGIAFTLRMNGFHKLADTIQSVIKESKSTKLTSLIK